MKLDFIGNTRRNMVAALANSGVKLLFPFLNRTLFLWLLGPQYLGLNGLFGSSWRKSSLYTRIAHGYRSAPGRSAIASWMHWREPSAIESSPSTQITYSPAAAANPLFRVAEHPPLRGPLKTRIRPSRAS